MKKRKLKKSLATTATVMTVTTGVTAISNSVKADTVQDNKNVIQQSLPDENKQAQQNVCAAQNEVNKANEDITTANNNFSIANDNLADADKTVETNKNQVKQIKEQLASLEQTKANAQQALINAHDEYYELLKQPASFSYSMVSGGGISVYEGTMLDYIAYDNKGNLTSKNEAYKNFLTNNYQGNIDFLKKIIIENEKHTQSLETDTLFNNEVSNLENEKTRVKKELEELYKMAEAQKEGKYYKPKYNINWVNTDSYNMSYSNVTANYNEENSSNSIHTKDLIKNHEEALNKIQQRLNELHDRMQTAMKKAKKTSMAAQELLQKLEQISQPLITATKQTTDAENAMAQARQNLVLQEELLTQAKDKRNVMQSNAINAQTKLLQALLNKTNSQEKLASAKEKLPAQTDALKYSSLVNLEPLAVEPGANPTPKVTTAIAVENDHQNKAIITLPKDKEKNKLPKGTKVVWKDDAKLATDLQHPGIHSEDVLIVFPDGSVILTNEQITVTVPNNKKNQIEVDKKTPTAQKTINTSKENNMSGDDIPARVIEDNSDDQISLTSETFTTPRIKQETTIKNQTTQSATGAPSLINPLKAKTANNVLPQTGDDSTFSIIALGAVIGLIGISAMLKRYE
ncbi:LPXTG cell wall anchor domain-containing protein [Limosilactobacillus caviae]|uniref:LPXTG cell wall anchor domain-containing protein n=1 Tax=Limosilactobacillus caviae TaxID=1769424 RepID=UPI0035192858